MGALGALPGIGGAISTLGNSVFGRLFKSTTFAGFALCILLAITALFTIVALLAITALLTFTALLAITALISVVALIAVAIAIAVAVLIVATLRTASAACRRRAGSSRLLFCFCLFFRAAKETHNFGQ